MSEVKLTRPKVEKLRYQPNKRSYYLALLAILFNVVNLFTVINSTSVRPTFEIGVKILLNIILLLVIFLGMEKMKVYNKRWGIIIIILGALAFARILWMPLNINDWSKETRNQAALILEKETPTEQELRQAEQLVARADEYDSVRKSSIVFLSITGTLLVLSGVDAYIKSRKLEDYLKEV